MPERTFAAGGSAAPSPNWPAEVRTALQICSSMSFPALILIGPDLLLYANSVCLREKVAADVRTQFAPCAEAWPELWERAGAACLQVFTTGQSAFLRDVPMPIPGKGEDCFFHLSLSPVLLSDNSTGAVWCVLHETTPRLTAERRMDLIRELALQEDADMDFGQACRITSEILGRYSNDILFADFYSLRSEDPELIVSTAAPETPIAPEELRTVAERDAAEVLQLTNDQRADRALLLPLKFAGNAKADMAAVLGMRRCEESEELYRSFLDIISSEVHHALARVHSQRIAQLIAEQARELQRSNEELERFAYTASHDLQEPLRTVLAFSQMLARRNAQRFSAEDEEQMAFILEAASRMSQLISGLLEYSRAGEARMENLGSVDLNSVVHDVVSNLSFAISETGARISVGALPIVTGERGMLMQLFQNLLSNSIRYRKPDVPPEIHVSASRRSPNEWLIVVKDNGIGFRQEYADTIFGMFKRLHGRNYSGTGIGLAISRKIVERHGGQIRAESAEGAGATFLFTLPAGDSRPYTQ